MLLNATVQDVESFVREFMRQTGTQTTIVEAFENVHVLLFRLVYMKGGIECYFDWGNAEVSWTDQKIKFSTKLHFGEINKFVDEDPLLVEQFKEMFQGYFTELNFELLKKFGKAETTKPEKPGRPNLPDDVWAWEQIYIHNRPKAEVKKSWLARVKEDPERRNNLATSLDTHFKRITKREWHAKD